MELVLVPAGKFKMGSSSNDPSAIHYSNEKRQHEVDLDAFWIDRTEVTNAMFARFAEQTKYKTRPKVWGILPFTIPSLVGEQLPALTGNIHRGQTATSTEWNNSLSYM